MIRIALQQVATQRGYNISRLQRESGLTMSMVRRYWLNETKDVRLEAIDRLCDMLGVEPGDLIKREPTTTKEPAHHA